MPLSDESVIGIVTNKYGDCEEFAERELKINDKVLQSLPIGTILLALRPPSSEPVQTYQKANKEDDFASLEEIIDRALDRVYMRLAKEASKL